MSETLNLCACGCSNPCKMTYKKGHARKNKLMSEDHKNKIRLANKGRKVSEETIKKTKKTKLEKGSLNRKPSDLERLKHSLMAKEKGFGLWMKGRKMDEESRLKNSISKMGHLVSESTRKKISDKNNGKNNGMYKRTHSDEAKKKISEASKLMWKNKEIRNKIMNHPNLIEKCKKGALAKAIKYPIPRFTNTKPERDMSQILIGMGIIYQQSYPLWELKNPYAADFYIPEIHTIIETDGKYYHNYPDYTEKDISRTIELQEKGYFVLRFWEDEFDLKLVTSKIEAIKSGNHVFLFQEQIINERVLMDTKVA